MKIGNIKEKIGKNNKENGSEKPELLKMKKAEILEIMLRQGEEIDKLREQITVLEKQLASKDAEFEKILSQRDAEFDQVLAEKQAELENFQFNISKFGSIAEASLQVTDIFKEAERAAKIYIENLRRRYG